MPVLVLQYDDEDDEEDEENLEFALVNNLDGLFAQMDESEAEFRTKESPYLGQRPYEILANIE